MDGDADSYDELLHVRRRYVHPEALRKACAVVATATLAVRNPAVWGEAGTACASDSTKFGAWDRNLMTEWHVRYGGRGVMIYWHVERRATCIYSQLKRCSSSEVAAMAHPHHHAESSARKFGGVAADYAYVHDWFDLCKAFYSGFTHRALRHHAQGVFEAERVFGRTLTNSDGRVVPVRFIGEQHVKEDCGGRVPSLQDWVERIAPAAWMSIGHILEDAPATGSATVAEWAAEVAAGRTILGYLDWIRAARRPSARGERACGAASAAGL